MSFFSFKKLSGKGNFSCSVEVEVAKDWNASLLPGSESDASSATAQPP